MTGAAATKVAEVIKEIGRKAEEVPKFHIKWQSKYYGMTQSAFGFIFISSL